MPWGDASRVAAVADMTNEDTLRRRMHAVAAGDAEALASLFEETRSAIFGLVLAVLGTRDGADDVLVDTYVQVWRSAAGYDPHKGGVRTWIATVARRLAIDRLRRRRRELPTGPDAAELDGLVGGGPTPIHTTLAGEAAGRVRRALARLDAGQRRALEAVYFEGLTHAEAAAALDQPLGTLKGRVRAALSHLRNDLALRQDGAI
jgi:RNA polymerase sigma-70 factor (ECF subfamily)